jgi:hypothetical protein
MYGSCLRKRATEMCSKPSPKMRLVMWLIVCITAALLFGLLRHEAKVRESQLCGVVIHVHDNAKFRAGTEHRRVTVLRNYLQNATPAERSQELYALIVRNMPQSLEDVRVADANVRATTPPPICLKYRSN